MNTSVIDTLENRGSVYGSFEAQVACVGGIVEVMQVCAEKNNISLNQELIAEWHYLAIKLARIASNPNHTDSYHNLAGYAMLMEKERINSRDKNIENKDIKMLQKKQTSKKRIKKIDAITIEFDGIALRIENAKKGTDFRVFMSKDGIYTISNSKTYNTDKELIGGFHYGLIPDDFVGNKNISKKNAKKICGINAYSIWDQTHRPICNPSGMVYIKKANIWVDIYLCNSDYGEKGTSASSGSILAGNKSDGRSIPDEFENLKYSDFQKIGDDNCKRMPTKSEFQIAMNGVEENVSAEEEDDGTIKHIDFLTSKYGIEQATGVQWVWSADKYKDYNDRALILGGARGNTSYSGSRASHWFDHVWGSSWVIGCRFACDNMNLI